MPAHPGPSPKPVKVSGKSPVGSRAALDHPAEPAVLSLKMSEALSVLRGD